jgi:hypothetical protein
LKGTENKQKVDFVSPNKWVNPPVFGGFGKNARPSTRWPATRLSGSSIQKLTRWLKPLLHLEALKAGAINETQQK